MFDWGDFIAFAKELISSYKTNYSEALYRTVISRCYYGIFKQVEDCLDNLNISLPEEDSRGRRLGSHEKRIYFLQTHDNSNVRRFGYKLNELKRQRKKADYMAEEGVSRFEANRALNTASDLSNMWMRAVRTYLTKSMP